MKIQNDVSIWSIFILRIFDTLGNSTNIMNQKQLAAKERHGSFTDNSINVSSSISTKPNTTPKNLHKPTKNAQYLINSSNNIDSMTLNQENISESSTGLFSTITKRSSLVMKESSSTTKTFHPPISEHSPSSYSLSASFESTTTRSSTRKEPMSTSAIRSQYSIASLTSKASMNSSTKIGLSSTTSFDMLTSGDH